MRRARWVAVTGAAATVFLFAGVPAAQQPVPSPPSPSQPGPSQPPGIQRPPTGPGVETPTPSKPDKGEEREPPSRPEISIPQERVPEQLRAPRGTTFVGPDLFNPPPHQGFITITPSFTLSGEYNDNLFLASRDKVSDGIIGFTPGVTLTLQRPGFRLAAGYNTTAQLFLQESDLSGFAKQHRFFADLLYEISPRLTFTLAENFVYDRNSNALTSGGVSVGFETGLSNTFTPALRWQATPNTGLTLVGSYSTVRFLDAPSNGSAVDSDTYRVGLGVDHRLTQRLSGGASMFVAYIDEERSKPAWTYTPSLSAAYEFTPTLRGWVSGGATVVERDGDTSVGPALGAGLSRTFKFGALSVGYDRSVTAETVGIADRQAVFGSLDVLTLIRGLHLSFTPRYSIADTDVAGNRSGRNETIKTLTLTLEATYQIARSINLIGSYSFFRQTSERGGVGDVDQNRIYLGLQYAFPISIY